MIKHSHEHLLSWYMLPCQKYRWEEGRYHIEGEGFRVKGTRWMDKPGNASNLTPYLFQMLERMSVVVASLVAPIVRMGGMSIVCMGGMSIGSVDSGARYHPRAADRQMKGRSVPQSRLWISPLGDSSRHPADLQNIKGTFSWKSFWDFPFKS
jgi:hypothetical protein